MSVAQPTQPTGWTVQTKRSYRPFIVFGVLAAILVVAGQLSPGQFAPATPSHAAGIVAAAPAGVAAPTAMKVTGTNDGNTKRFELGAGNYRVVVSGKSTSEYGGNVIAVLYNSEGAPRWLANEIVDGLGSYTFTTYEYDYAGGRYYLDVTAPSGSWSVAFTPES